MKKDTLVIGGIILATGGIAYYVYKKRKLAVSGGAGLGQPTASGLSQPIGTTGSAPPVIQGFTGTAGMTASMQDLSTGPQGFVATVAQTANGGTVTNGGFSGTAAKTVPTPLLTPGLPVFNFPLAGGGVLKTNVQPSAGPQSSARSGAGHF